MRPSTNTAASRRCWAPRCCSPAGRIGQPLLNTPTETPKAGTTEIWEIYNLTGDTHPIHFHLVDVQVLSRQAFVVKFGQFTKMGTPTPPDAD